MIKNENVCKKEKETKREIENDEREQVNRKFIQCKGIKVNKEIKSKKKETGRKKIKDRGTKKKTNERICDGMK